MLYGMVRDSLTDAGDGGEPAINEMLIRPFTEEQSGTPGTLRFEDTLLKFGGKGEDEDGSSGAGRSLQVDGDGDDDDGLELNFTLSDLRITNLDTIVPPLELLELTNSPTTLRNSLNMGNGTAGRPLEVSFRLGIGMGDSWTEVDMVASIDSLSLFADISAQIDAAAFFELPLSSILNFNCWLSALDAVELDSNGVAVDPAAARGLSLAAFSTSMTSLQFGTDCIACEDAGTGLLPDLVQILEDTGAVGTLGDRLPELMESVLKSDALQTTLDRLIADAPRFCPSSPLYEGEDAEPTEYDFFDFPALSAKSIDTVLFAGVMVAESAFIMFAETQRLAEIEPTSPLSAQDAFDPPEDVKLIDWTDIGNSTGLGGVADQVFDGAREFLGGGDEGSLFDLEDILDDLIDENGVLEVESNFAFELDDFTISIDSIRINGLEEFEMFDVFEPIAPQTLSVSAQFDLLDLEIVLSADAPSTPDPPQVITVRLAVQNVTADIAIFAAFDLDKLGALGLGSLLNTDSLLPCIMSTAYAFEIPQMKVTVGSFSKPTIEGLLPETEEVTNQLTDVLFDRFRSNIEEAIPKIFDGVGRDLVAGLLSSADESTCESAAREVSEGVFVDFRDLILPEAQARLLGGTGEAPYGTVISSIFEILKEEFFVADPDTGLAAVNEKLIAKLGESQSDVPGRLFFPGSMFNAEPSIKVGGLAADISLRVSDIFINNLDTFGVPLVLLEPLDGEAHLLNNSATVGLGRPLEIGLRFFLGLYGKGKLLGSSLSSCFRSLFGTENPSSFSSFLDVTDDSEPIENDVIISLDMDTLKVLLGAFLQFSEKAFMEFPLRGTFSISFVVRNCLLPLRH